MKMAILEPPTNLESGFGDWPASEETRGTVAVGTVSIGTMDSAADDGPWIGDWLELETTPGTQYRVEVNFGHWLATATGGGIDVRGVANTNRDHNRDGGRSYVEFTVTEDHYLRVFAKDFINVDNKYTYASSQGSYKYFRQYTVELTDISSIDKLVGNQVVTGKPDRSTLLVGSANGRARAQSFTTGANAGDLLEALYSYQWLADDADIASATASTYTLTAGDAGDTIKVQVSFTDDDGNDETLVSAATTPVVHPQFTASIEGHPAAHAGSSTFAFEVRFSDEFSISYKTLRDHALAVTGCEVTGVRRLAPPSNAGWEITVSPDDNADVTIVLPVTGDCAAQGVICTEDGRPLSSRLEITVPGPGG